MRTRLFLIVALLLPASLLAATESMPAVSHDGLHLQKSDGPPYVYLAPGASLAGYDKVWLVQCEVAFQKDWQQEQNMNALTSRDRVSANDMQRMRDNLSAEFNRVFTEVLETEGGHPLVDTAADDVLIVKPAIINLVVTSPATKPSTRKRSNLTSAGAMTLYAELYDSATGSLLVRVIDPQVSRTARFETEDAKLVNQKEADKILRDWASRLNAHLGKAGLSN